MKPVRRIACYIFKPTPISFHCAFDIFLNMFVLISMSVYYIELQTQSFDWMLHLLRIMLLLSVCVCAWEKTARGGLEELPGLQDLQMISKSV